MNVAHHVRLLCLSLAVILFPVPALSAGGASGMLKESDLARVRKKVEALRAWQLTEELDLDQETSSRLFPAMKDADKDRQRIEVENRALYREMVRLINSDKPDPGIINDILDQLQANRMETARLEEKHLKQVREILSPEDSARYLIFQVQFQRELREKAARAFREGREPQDSDSVRSQEGADRSGGSSSGNGTGGNSDRSGGGMGKR